MTIPFRRDDPAEPARAEAAPWDGPRRIAPGRYAPLDVLAG